MATDDKAPHQGQHIFSIPTLIASLVCAQIAVLFCEPYICEPFQLGAYVGILAYLTGLALPVIARIAFIALHHTNRRSLAPHDI